MAELEITAKANFQELIDLRKQITELKAQIEVVRNSDLVKEDKMAQIDNLSKQMGGLRVQYELIAKEAIKSGSDIQKGFTDNLDGAKLGVENVTKSLQSLQGELRAKAEEITQVTEKIRQLGSIDLNAPDLDFDELTGQEAELIAQLTQLQIEHNKLSTAVQNTSIELIEETETLEKAQDDYDVYVRGIKSAGEANTQLDANTKKIIDSLNAQQKKMEELSEAQERTAQNLGRLSNGFKGLLTTLGVGASLGMFVKQIVSTRQQIQGMETSLKVLMGSEEKATDLLTKLKGYAATSPLDVTSVTSAAQQMIGFNIEAEKVPRFIQAIGDVSMGNQNSFRGLTLAFSQMSATGKLMGQDLMQMINAGFNPLTEISRKTGKSVGQLKEEMSKGAISAKMVQDAFISATEAGGKFAGMSAEAAKTISGQFSMLQDAVDRMFNEIGTEGEGIITNAISLGTKLVENYKEIGKVILSLVATYGVYKTALLVNIALQSAQAHGLKGAVVALRQQIPALANAIKSMKAFNAVLRANPIGMVVTAVLALGTAISALTLSVDKEKRAEEHHKELLDKIANQETARKDKIESLIGTINDETNSVQKQIGAYNELIKLSPKIAETYSSFEDFKQSLKNENEDINKSIAQESEQNISDVKKKNLEELRSYVKKLDEESQLNNAEKVRNDAIGENILKNLGIDVGWTENVRDIARAELKKLEEEAEKELSAKTEAEWIAKPIEERIKIKQAELESARAEADKAQNELNAYNSQYAEQRAKVIELKAEIEEAEANGDTETANALRNQLSAINQNLFAMSSFSLSMNKASNETKKAKEEVAKLEAEINSLTETQKKETGGNYLQERAKAIKEYYDAERKYYKLSHSRTSTKQEVADAKAEMEGKKSTATGLGGVVYDTEERRANTKAINDARKQREREEKRQHEEEAKTYRDNQYTLEQSRINVMKDGAEKRRLQRAFDHRKEIDEINAQFDEEKKKAIDNAKTLFDADEEIRAKQEIAKGNKNYQKEEFNENAWASGAGVSVFATIDDERKKRIELNNQEYLESERQAQQDELSDIQNFYENYLNIIADYEQKKKDIQDQIRDGEVSGEQGKYLLKTAEIERDEALESGGYTDEEMQAKVAGLQDVIHEVVNSSIESVATLIDDLEIQLKNAELTGNTKEVEKLKKELKLINQLQGQKPKIDGWKEYKNVLSNCSREMKNLGNTIGGTLGKIINDMTEVFDSTIDIIDGLEQLGKKEVLAIGQVAEGTMEATKQTAITAGESIKAVEKASVILAIISAVIQIAMKVASLLSGKSAMDEAKEKAQEITDEIAELQREAKLDTTSKDTIFGNDVWGRLVKNSNLARNALNTFKNTISDINSKYADKELSGKDVLAKIQQGEKLEYKDGKAYTQNEKSAKSEDEFALALARLRNAETQIEHSTMFRSAKYSTLGAMGYNFAVYKSNDLGELTNELDYSASIEAVKKFKEEGGGYYNELETDAKNAIEEMIKAWEDYEKTLDKVTDSYSEWFGGMLDSYSDAIVNQWRTGEDAALEYGDTVNDMLLNMLKSQLNNQFFGDLIEQSSKEMAEISMGTGDDKSKAEKLLLKVTETKDKMLEASEGYTLALDAYNEMLKTQGIDLRESASEQESTWGGYETMSEETGTELSGRFSAMYVVQSAMLEESKNFYSLALTDLSTIKQGIQQHFENMMNVVSNGTNYLLSQQLIELKAINENTETPIKILKNLNDKIDLWHEHIMNL